MLSLLCFLLLLGGAWLTAKAATEHYEALISIVIYDRTGTPISIKENSKGHYVHELTELPNEFSKLLLAKEDRYFYLHPGINPISTLRSLYHLIKNGDPGGSSTLTQQLAKNLLGNESDRTITNKLIESWYALSLELFMSKGELLIWYANSVYLGNQVQGFDTASRAYFDKPLSDTTYSEQLSLLATLSHPSSRNPWETDNDQYAAALGDQLAPGEPYFTPGTTDHYSFQDNTYFELRTAGINCTTTCHTTVDSAVTATIRDVLARHIEASWSRNIKNGAVVVLDTHSMELVALIGSRNPHNQLSGDQINMALEPRPIGSTIKPFIYAKGFSDGLRPYTLVEDREYKYPIASGYALYPKNYDGLYRGEITLHEALSNSLNVPSVKTLEFIGLESFYNFLSDTLHFAPIQDLNSYQYGIALGGLEMDLLTLTHYFSLFPNNGNLAPLKVLHDSNENFNLPPQSNIIEPTMVVDKQYIELVHAILSDRFTGVNQFGVNGNLVLSINEYGVKTGTSRDFHDSWVIGYTPELVVGVWLGNSVNEPLEQVSGQSGAGAVWHDVMEYLVTTPYYHHETFEPEHLERFLIGGNEEWGLKGDLVEEHRQLLQQNNLILSIHEGDEFELEPGTTIPLRARKSVLWSVNDTELTYAKETIFSPTEPGTYEIFAFDQENNVRESLLIHLTTPQ